MFATPVASRTLKKTSNGTERAFRHNPYRNVRSEAGTAAVDLFHRPSALVGTDYLSRDPLVQIGHQDFRLFRAQVPPAFTQHHSDVADVPQTQAGAIHPEGFAAFPAREAGPPDALIIFALKMGHQVFERIILVRCPSPG